MNKEVRVRFAPSPTGYLHVGGARTALFNYLFARHFNGTFILRIEDTDQTRYQESALDEIFTSLEWLGIGWDEGPKCGGNYGPYFQSQRTDLYKKYADQLIENGVAYYCFCSPERLQKLRQQQEQEKKQHIIGYDRHCRDLSHDEVRRLLEQGIPHVVRLKVPYDRTVVFHDLVRGAIEYQSEVLDDLVLLKSDGFPTYHLANVVDDHLMGISHVLRGEEWIVSTPRHILIYEAFGWEPPQFAHMPIILAPGGGKLSKRKGAASVTDYKNSGYLPEALFNFLALLGWAPGDDREIMNSEEIIQAFTLEKISPKASVFDEQKLEWMNGTYMQQRSVESLYEQTVSRWVTLGYIDDTTAYPDWYYKRIIELLKDRSKKTTDLAQNAGYFFDDPQTYEEKAAKKHFKPDTPHVLKKLVSIIENVDPFDHQTLENAYREYAESSGISAGKMIHPTRLAVSGVSFGPGLFELLEVLGKETVVRRMKSAIAWLENR